MAQRITVPNEAELETRFLTEVDRYDPVINRLKPHLMVFAGDTIEVEELALRLMAQRQKLEHDVELDALDRAMIKCLPLLAGQDKDRVQSSYISFIEVPAQLG